MPVTQAQANRILGNHEEAIAKLLGVAVPSDLDIVVLSPEEFHAMNGFENTPVAGQVGHTVYIASNVAPEQLAHFVVYEAAHAISSGQGMGDVVGTGGKLQGGVAARTAEAVASVVTDRVLNEGWTPTTGPQKKVNALSDADLATVGTALASGDFKSVKQATDQAQEDKKGQVQDAISNIATLMGDFLTGKYQWNSLSTEQQEQLMTLANTSTDIKKYTEQVQQNEPNAPAEAQSNDVRALAFNQYLKDHFSDIYDKVLHEGITNGTISAGAAGTGLLHYVGVNQGGATTVDPKYAPAAGAGGTTVTWTDPTTGLTVTGPDTNGNGIPDFIDGSAGAGTTDTTKADTAKYTAYVKNLNIDPGGNVGNLIQRAVAGGWTTEHFQNALYKTPDFQQAFPGIFNEQGGLKMSVAAYSKLATSYQDSYSQAGVKLTPQEQASLFRNDVSSNEAADRAAKEGYLRRNPEALAAFNKELKLAGQPTVDKRGLFDVLGGQGPQKARELWDNATARYTANQAGIQIGGDKQGSVNVGLIHSIANKGLSAEALSSGFQQMAKDLHETLPLAKIQGYGLTRKQLSTVAFGGKGRQDVLEKIAKIHAQESAFNENRVTTQDYADAQGNVGVVGGSLQRRAQSA